MAAKSQPSSPLSRLSRIGISLGFRLGPSSPLARTPDRHKGSDEDYIPYHGPYEPPARTDHPYGRDNWGNLASGWSEDDPAGHHHQVSLGQRTRDRAASSASRISASSGHGDHHRRTPSTRHASRAAALSSYINLDQAGGIGDSPTPMPPRRLQDPSRPESNRTSFVNMLSFGQGSKRAGQLHHSASAGNLQHGLPSPTTPIERDYADDPSRADSSLQLPAEPKPTYPPRRHPYAYAPPFQPKLPPMPPIKLTSADQPAAKGHGPTSKFSVTLLEPLTRKPSTSGVPPYLKSSRSPVGRSLKASISTPNLRQSARPPIPVTVPRGKQRWLSAETWCDALILPRPRFAVRETDSAPSTGRIVSPPDSPVWSTSKDGDVQMQTMSGEDQPWQERSVQSQHGLRKTRSAVQLASSPPPMAVGRAPAREVVEEEPRERTTISAVAAVTSTLSPAAEAKAGTTLTVRPKSFAWDDLALPSPVPSLARVLEDGRQLEEDRKAWQSQATRSFQNARARSVSRARAKSVSNLAAQAAGRDGRGTAFGALAERTLMGSQSRPPTVHSRMRRSTVDEQGTIIGTGTATGTVTSASHHTHARTHSHTHSTSGGTGTFSSHPHSSAEESFMHVGQADPSGHVRSHSLGKSALRLVRSTATTAATLCGFVPAERERGSVSPVEEVGQDLEGALRREGTRVIRLQDQRRAEEHPRDGEGVVHILSTSPVPSVNMPGVGMGGVHGVSPVPSGLSAEGVGIAISTPPPSDEHSWQQRAGLEPVRFHGHPYAQGATYQYHRQASPSRQEFQSAGTGSGAPGVDDNLTRFRQPVHPWSSYAQGAHPYAMSGGTVHDSVVHHSHLRVQPSALASNTSLYAELSPGRISEFQPDEIRYSPFTPEIPIVHPLAPQSDAQASSSTVPHPYGAPPSNRLSEWGFADALTHTLRRHGTADSDPGPSERRAFAQGRQGEQSTPDMLSLSAGEGSPGESAPSVPSLPVPAGTPIASHSRPAMRRDASSGHTLASSPMDSINPPVFQPSHSSSHLTGNSSTSSPGMISHESSPPLSPRPLNGPDDLERFRNLFYQPPDPERSRTPSEEFERPGPPREASGTIPIDIGHQSTRTVSGLTTLARQLTEDLEELQDSGRQSFDQDVPSPSWGRRFGGLRGQRPDDMRIDPNIVLARTSSRHDLPPMTTSPLRLPIDHSLVLAQPTINVPEDVESSRPSSELDMPVYDDETDETLRVGSIAAVSTPPPFATEQRFSSRLSFIGYARGGRPRSQSYPRIVSQNSSLGAPLSSDALRSSFATGDTGTSRMSGLSDFPVPPTDITPAHTSVLNTYFDDSSRVQLRPAPTLSREPSSGTFGRRRDNDVGEAP
ncbi:hypothetical protein B0H21DRAFT_104970 [Amylocystis lapponica]|nr:hypothetical protein B0H21DRAFT_104970 [Amylocystis lapponica]